MEKKEENKLINKAKWKQSEESEKRKVYIYK
jgi:hypothetical protein